MSDAALDSFTTFGQLLKYLRRRARLTQKELGIAVGYSEGYVARLEGDKRRPVPATVRSLFVEALGLRAEPDVARRLVDLADAPRSESLPDPVPRPTLHIPGRTNLPAPLTPLVGRAEEVARAGGLLQRPDVRLVTLVGPPGVGKTRLALQVAADLSATFADGAWLVALASVTDPELVAPAVAAAVGARLEVGQAPLDGLVSYLRERHLLLVVDNFEQVLAAAPQVAQLLTGSPGVKVLCTSRVPLHVTGEHEWPVPPLGLPDRSGPPSPDALAGCPSVELFLQRARAVKPAFALTAVNARAVADVCRRLDGLPLAIELAAARVKALTPQALLDGLTPRAHLSAGSETGPSDPAPFSLLTGGPRDALPRQQTLWDTLDWSYHLLTAEEQAVFRCLGVFVNGCTPAAAAVACEEGPDGEPPPLHAREAGPVGSRPGVVEVLQALLEHSLVVQADGSGGPPRYAMLELVREFAARRLESSGRADAVHRRHAEYFARLADRASPLFELTGSWRDDALYAELTAEYDNLLAALAWCQGRGDRVPLELSIASAIAWLLIGDRLNPGHHPVTADLLARLDHTLGRRGAAPPAQRILLLYVYAGFTRVCGQYARARALAEEGVAVCRQAGDRPSQAAMLWRVGHAAYQAGDYEYATCTLGQLRDVWVELGDGRATHAAHLLGRVALEQGRFSAAAALFEQTLAAWRRSGDMCLFFGGVMDALIMLGLAIQLLGDGARSERLEEEVLRMCGSGDKAARIWVLLYLGRAALQRSGIDQAVQYFTQSLSESRDVENFLSIAVGLDELAGARWTQGRTREAAGLVAMADTIRRALAPMPPVTCLAMDHEHLVATVDAHLDDPDIASAWAIRDTVTMDQILAYVSDLTARAECEGLPQP